MKLVDTSAWIEYLRATNSSVHLEAKRLLESGEAARCEIIGLELANNSSAYQEPRLTKIQRLAWMLDIDSQVWRTARRVATAARRSGVSAPLPDLVVFACSKLYGLEVLHKQDSDFGRLEQVFERL